VRLDGLLESLRDSSGVSYFLEGVDGHFNNMLKIRTNSHTFYCILLVIQPFSLHYGPVCSLGLFWNLHPVNCFVVD
jgi:hypothetical protein